MLVLHLQRLQVQRFSQVWTPASDNYGNPTMQQHDCMSQIFVCKLMTLLTFLILNWVLAIKGLRAHTRASKGFYFDATLEAVSTCFTLRTWDFLHIINRKPLSHPRQLTLSLRSTAGRGEGVDCGIGSRGFSQCMHMRKQVWLVLSGEIKKPSHKSGQLLFIWMHYQGPRIDNSLISTAQTSSDNTGEKGACRTTLRVN